MRANILELTGSFHQGGSERQALQISRLLREDDSYNVFFAALNNEGVLKAEAESYGFNEVPEFRLTSFYDANMIRQMNRFKKFVKEKNISLIHTHDFYTNVFGIFGGMYGGVPVRIASKRETGGIRSAKQDFVERIVYRFSDLVTVNALSVKDYLVKAGVPENKLELTYNGLDLKRLEPQPGKTRKQICIDLGLPTDENLRFIPVVANMRHTTKNQQMFLRVAARMKGLVKDVRFILAGEGELVPGLKKMSEELGVADICHFIGRCTHVPDLLTISEICALTSNYEGFSNSILEYMAASKPVVTTNVSGASEAVIDGETGFIVDLDDDKAMAERLTLLLNDPGKCREMGIRGRKVIEQKFSTEAQLKRLKELYDSLLSKKA